MVDICWLAYRLVITPRFFSEKHPLSWSHLICSCTVPFRLWYSSTRQRVLGMGTWPIQSNKTLLQLLQKRSSFFQDEGLELLGINRWKESAEDKANTLEHRGDSLVESKSWIAWAFGSNLPEVPWSFLFPRSTKSLFHFSQFHLGFNHLIGKVPDLDTLKILC